MAYQPYTGNYTSPNASAIAAIAARQLARRNQVASQMSDGNQVMGNLTTVCCDDPGFGGQSYYDGPSPDTMESPLGTPVSAATASPSASSTPVSSDPIVNAIAAATVPTSSGWTPTPVDLIMGTVGFQLRTNGKPWPRPRLPRSMQRKIAAAFPNYGPGVAAASLMPGCPCGVPSPGITTSTPAPVSAPAPAAPKPACPYPGCSTGNVCLDLITGCVSNSQVTQAQVEACTEAGYSVFGNSGSYLSSILVGCGTNLPYLGTPLPSPPQATGAMENTLATANAAAAAINKQLGLAGLGQDDSGSQIGGFLAVIAMFGIVVWATRK